MTALKQLKAGRKAADVGREMGVSKHAVYAWKAQYGGLNVNEAQRLRLIEGTRRVDGGHRKGARQRHGDYRIRSLRSPG